MIMFFFAIVNRCINRGLHIICHAYCMSPSHPWSRGTGRLVCVMFCLALPRRVSADCLETEA